MRSRWHARRAVLVAVFLPLGLSLGGGSRVASGAPTSWTFLGRGGESVRALAVSGTDLYAGSETGLYRRPLSSLDTLWTPTPLDSVGVLSLLALDDTTMLAVAEWYPEGSDYPEEQLYRSGDQGISWSQVVTSALGYGPRMHLAGHPMYPDTVYIAQRPAIKSIDAGLTWSTADPNPGAFFVRDWLEVSSVTPGTLWLGGESGFFAPVLYRSQDGGATWPYFRQPPSSSENAVRCIRVDPLDESRVYLGMEGYVDRTTDAGATWQTVYSLPGYWFSDIEIDPQHPERLVATGNSNPGCTVQRPSVIVSVDGGSFWTAIENGTGPSGFHGDDVELTVETGHTVAFVAGTGVYRVDDAVTTGIPESPVAGNATRLLPPLLRAGSVVIRYRTDRPGRVRLTILDALGRRVRTFDRESPGAGEQRIDWKADDDAGRKVAEGIYFLRFEAGNSRLAQKLPVIAR